MQRGRTSLAIVFAALISGCSSPAQPTTQNAAQPVAVQAQAYDRFEGTWKLDGVTTACTSARGVCQGWAIGGAAESRTLRLHQNGKAVFGTLSNSQSLLTEVNGTVDDDGRLRLSGTQTWNGECPGAFELSNLAIQLDDVKASGSYDLASNGKSSLCTFYWFKSNVKVTSFTRLSTSLSIDQVGGWSGFVRWTLCTDGRPCSVGTSWSSEGVSVVAANGALEAHFGSYGGRAFVTSASGPFQFSGTYTKPLSDGRAEYRIVSSSLRQDELGRLTGAVTYHQDVYRDGQPKLSSDVTMELLRFARVE